jgi:hypothetical protein
MSKPRKPASHIVLPREDFEEMLCRAAERGAKRALINVGLDGPDAANDVRELRSLLSALQFAKRTALQTTVRVITVFLLLALITGIAFKLRLIEFFGGK